MIKKLYYDFITPEKTNRKIGIFRTLCSIFGGLFLAYFAMTLIALLIPGELAEKTIIPLLFNTLAWALASLWIIIAPSKLIALLRFLIPTLIFLILIFILS